MTLKMTNEIKIEMSKIIARLFLGMVGSYNSHIKLESHIVAAESNLGVYTPLKVASEPVRLNLVN